jgi:hypothetical protein
MTGGLAISRSHCSNEATVSGGLKRGTAATSRSDKLSQLFMSAHDESLSVPMRVLFALPAVVENGYD